MAVLFGSSIRDETEPKVKLSAFNQVGYSANLNVEQVVYAFLARSDLGCEATILAGQVLSGLSRAQDVLANQREGPLPRPYVLQWRATIASV